MKSKSYVGKIFHYSWGYDMTINEYLLVISETPKTVKAVKIGKSPVSGDHHAGSEIPDKSKIKSKPFILRKDNSNYIKKYYDGWGLRGSDPSRSSGYSNPQTWTLWDGSPDAYNYMD